MPYLKEHDREVFREPLDDIIGLINWTQSNQAGKINYIIAYLVSQLIQERGCSYEVLNEFIGALECCKLELYRRLAAPYEDHKCEENGDVF